MIKGLVAEIIDNRTLALNIGSKQGVGPGMVFQIFDKVGKTIKDPDNGNILGFLKLPKIQVKITYTQDSWSIAETFHYTEKNVGGLNAFGSVSSLMASPKYIKQYDTFEIDETQKKEIDKEKSIVKIGDVAELVAK